MLITNGENKLQSELDEFENLREFNSDAKSERTALEYKQLGEEIDAELEGRYQLRKQIIMRFKDRANEINSMIELGSISKDEGQNLIDSARRDAEKELKKIDNL